jgi:hypothetical protein
MKSTWVLAAAVACAMAVTVHLDVAVAADAPASKKIIYQPQYHEKGIEKEGKGQNSKDPQVQQLRCEGYDPDKEQFGCSGG